MQNRTLYIVGITGLLMLSIVGCDSKQEKVQKKMVGIMDEYADVLSGIKSNTDFVDAKPKLEKLGEKLKDAMNEAKALPNPTAEEQKKLEAEMAEANKKASARIQSELERLDKIGVSTFEVMDAMKVDPTMFMH